jgi:hypothetical protein
MLAVGRDESSIELWDLGNRQLRAVYHPHTAGFDLRLMWFAADGATLVSFGQLSGRVMTLDMLRWRIAALRGSAVSPPHELVIFKTDDGRPLLRTSDEGFPCVSPDGHFLATLHHDGTVQLRDLPGW